ncbi:transposase [Schlesneria paludicola]|uniref:transposase n=1 Tax=Schlesneria paludicola TaxID=360056 RepID=UPI000299CEEC|nr:transposase [Schlesneria paludicola]
MPRSPRADEAGGLYHALNRGNGRQEIFHKSEDFAAFERVLAEGLASYDVTLFCFQLMPNHWHLVLRPNADGELSRFMRWITATHTMRYRAHYRTSGEGHVYQGRFKSFPIQDDAHFLTVCRYVERNAVRAGLVKQAEDWRWGSLWRWMQPADPDPALLSPWPIPRSPNWVHRVNEPLTEQQLSAIRKSAQKGSPHGSLEWIEQTAVRLGLASTLRNRGRQRIHFPEIDDQNTNIES